MTRRRVWKLAAVGLVVVTLAAAGAAAEDGFEDGDFSANPMWFHTSAGGTAQVQQSTVFNGNDALELSVANGGGDESLVFNRTADGDNSIATGNTFQAAIRTDNIGFTQAWAMSNDSTAINGNGAVGFSIGSSGLEVYSRGSTSDIDSAFVLSNMSADTWYLTQMEYDVGAATVNASVYAEDGDLLNFTEINYDGGTVQEYIILENRDFNTQSFFLDDVTVQPNKPPSINNTDHDPEPARFGDSITCQANATDPENDAMQGWCSISFSNGTDITGTRAMNQPAVGNFELQDMTTVGSETTYFVNTTVGDGSVNTTGSTSFTLSDDAPTVTLFDPSGTTFDYDRTYRFHANDTDDRPAETFTCDLTNGTLLFDTVSGQENLSASGTFRGDLGTRTFDVSCDDGNGNTGTASSSYTVDDFRVEDNDTNRDNVFETVNDTFHVNLTAGDMLNAVNTTLYWNDTAVQTITDGGGNTVRFVNRSHYHVTPLVNANNTRHPWRFQLMRNRTAFNGSFQLRTTNLTEGDQDVFHAYSFLQQTLIGNPYLSGETYDLRTNFTYRTDNAALTGTNIYYRTGDEVAATALLADPGGNITYQGEQDVGGVDTPISDRYNTTTELLVEFDGKSRTITPGNTTITIDQPTLTGCGNGNNTVLEFNTFNESDRSVPVFSDLDMAIQVWKDPDQKQAFNFSSEDATTHSFCLYPSGASVTASTTEKLVQYEDDDEDAGTFGFNRRSYFIINETLNDSDPTTIPLYMIAKNISEEVEIEIEGDDANPEPQVVTRIQRYFPGQDQHITVAMVRTGSEGLSETFLEVNEIYYQFQMFKDRKLLAFRDDQIIPSDNNVFFQIGAEAEASYFEFKNKVGATCSEAVTFVNCTYSSRTESLDNITLTVFRQDAVTLTRICQNSAQTVSGELVCDGLNASDNRYQYSLDVELGSSEFVLDSGWLGSVSDLFGQVGVFGAFMLIVTSGMAGLFLPEAFVAFIVAGTVMSWAVGLLPMTIEAIMSLIAVALVLLWRMQQ